MKSVMMAVQHASRFIPMTITWSSGTPVIKEGSNHATIADTNGGIATITFVDSFARKPVIVGSCEAATGEKVTVTLRNVAQDSFIVEAINEAGSAADLTTDVHLMIFGFDSADEA